jgi:exodeoxyribonuclease V beta subunit
MNGAGSPPMPPFDVHETPLDGITLVEASAGTGKTWAICGLVLRLVVERGLPIGQLLVVTFTNAAAAELRERIRGRLALALRAQRGDASARDHVDVAGFFDALQRRGGLDGALVEERLRAALAAFAEAPVCTIHSFCQRALAEAPLAAGAPLSQTLLLDDSELRLDVAQDLWRRWVAGRALPPGLPELMAAMHDGPERWAEWLQWRAEQPLTQTIWPADLRDDAVADAESTAAALRAVHAQARAEWPRARGDVWRAVEQAREAELVSGGSYKSAEGTRASCESWDAVLAASEPFIKLNEEALRPLKRFASGTFKAKKDARRPVDNGGFFATAQAWLDAFAAHDRALRLRRMRLLKRLLDEGPEALREAKRAARVITFADMLGTLHHELTQGPRAARLAAALRARYPAALIDEFQDTDPLQWGIFETLYGPGSGAGPLVLVGDPKQSIYAFRQADLNIYLGARRRATRCGTLADNQRSTLKLVDGLNLLFGQREDPFRLEGLAYHPVRFGAKRRPPWHDTSDSAGTAPLCLWTLPSPPPPKSQARELAAQATAGEIARLLAAAARGEVQHDDRALAAGDIAVLVRTREQGAQMKQALAGRGIGSVELSNASVFASPDAETLDHFLTAVLNPQRESFVRTALAGVAMGWTAQQLHDGDGPALAAAMERFAAHRALWRQRGAAVMLRRWLMDDGVAQRLLAGPDGERRLTNLLHLVELLQAEAESHPSPESLHRWLQQQRRERRADDAAQQRLESDRLLVQIVTIHKSKGLEYPVVFCPFLFEGVATMRSPLEGRQYHDDETPRRDLRDKDELGTPLDERIKARVRSEQQEETMRRTYVALTRAVQRLVVVVGAYVGARGGTTEAEESPMAWLLGNDIPGFAARARAEAPGAVDVLPLPSSAEAAPVSQPASSTPVALPPPQRLPRAWVLSSYSRLVHAAQLETAAQDHDAHVPSTPTTPADALAASAAAADPDDILAFPRGPSAGECLHAAFERADFGDAATWPGAIAAALALHPQPGERQRLTLQLSGMLDAVLHTPLPLAPGRAVTLANVAAPQRLVELEFMLPGGPHRADALAALLARHGEAAPALAFHSQQGPLRGFIDLVFEHDGRYHVLDWKSNHLGTRAQDYAGPALQAAMAQHGYGLQRLLYVLALHRHLQARLRGYDYERHMGEALYLFVRGVRPAWPGAGVVAHRPPLALVEGLGRWLDGER